MSVGTSSLKKRKQQVNNSKPVAAIQPNQIDIKQSTRGTVNILDKLKNKDIDLTGASSSEDYPSIRDPEEVLLQLNEELDELPFDNDLSLRYELLIESLKLGDMTPQQLEQVCCHEFVINPFESIQLALKSNDRVSPRHKSIVKP